MFLYLLLGFSSSINVFDISSLKLAIHASIRRYPHRIKNNVILMTPDTRTDNDHYFFESLCAKVLLCLNHHVYGLECCVPKNAYIGPTLMTELALEKEMEHGFFHSPLTKYAIVAVQIFIFPSENVSCV